MTAPAQALDNLIEDIRGDAIGFEGVCGVARGNRVIGPSDGRIDVDHAKGDVLLEQNVTEDAPRAE